MTFRQQTDTYSLTVSLMDIKLVVTLEDYVDWVLYEKEFTEKDIGHDIHKKLDLADVYTVFNQTREIDSK